MAKLMTVAEAIASDDNDIIKEIRAKITMVHKVSSGEGQFGPWTLQNIILGDETGSIRVVLSNREEIPANWKGKTIQISAGQSEKHGWTGCKRETDKKTQKPQLKVTASATVVDFAAELQPEDNGESNPPKQSAPPLKQATNRAQLAQDKTGREDEPNTHGYKQNGPQSQPARSGPSVKEKMDEGAAILTQIANCQIAAICLVKNYVVPFLKVVKGIEVDALQEAALVQNMLISGTQKHNVNMKFPEYQFSIDAKTNGDTKSKKVTKPVQTDVPVDPDPDADPHGFDDDIPF